MELGLLVTKLIEKGYDRLDAVGMVINDRANAENIANA
jgi:hypothetical protein